MTTPQLSSIGNLSLNLSHSSSQNCGLRPSILSALKFTDALTTRIKVPDSIFSELKEEFLKEGSSEKEAENKMVEVTATISTYNMVSRFLVALDIDDRSQGPVPIPQSENHTISQIGGLLGGSNQKEEERGLVQLIDGNTLSTRVYFNSNTSPWILCVNSLLTNLHMWDLALPSLRSKYNVILYDQRGHGLSSVPKEGSNMHQLADDAASILDALGISKLHSIIGVSQGGATALSFAIRHSDRTARVIACDTQPSSPEANVKAWDDRIQLAKDSGMKGLANVTVPRWFGNGSIATDSLKEELNLQVSNTKLEGFIVGARALQNYDLFKDGLIESLQTKGFKSLLIAGEMDGKLPEGLENLKDQVGSEDCEFSRIQKAGHLPMCDNPREWERVVMDWLNK